MRIERDTVWHGRRAWQADTQRLGQTSLFHSVRDRDLKPLAAASMCRVYGRKDVVVWPEAESPTLCLIVQGLARLFRDSEHGEELTLHLLHDGGAYDPALLMAGITPQTSVLQILTNGAVVCQIPLRPARQLAASHPEILIEGGKMLSEQLEEAHQWMMAMRSETVRSRLEWTLQRLAGWDARHVVPLDYDVLASVVGAGRQAVTRELGNLRDEGLVEFRPHHRDGCILVPDPSRLCAANFGAM